MPNLQPWLSGFITSWVSRLNEMDSTTITIPVPAWVMAWWGSLQERHGYGAIRVQVRGGKVAFIEAIETEQFGESDDGRLWLR